MFIETEDIDIYFQSGLLSELTEDEGVKDYVVEYANNLVEVSLRNRYVLPLPEVPIAIKDVAKSIAKYKLYERVDAVTEDIQIQYKNAIQILRDFAEGKKTIDGLGKSQKPTRTKVISKKQVFTQEILDRY